MTGRLTFVQWRGCREQSGGAGGLELACSVGSVGGRAPRFRSGGRWRQRLGVAGLAQRGQACYSRNKVLGPQAQSPSWRGREALGPWLTWGVYTAPRLSLLAHSLPRRSGATRVPPQLPPLDRPSPESCRRRAGWAQERSDLELLGWSCASRNAAAPSPRFPGRGAAASQPARFHHLNSLHERTETVEEERKCSTFRGCCFNF